MIAQNAGVAQTSVGVTYLNFMKCVKHGDMLYMCTTDCITKNINICISLGGQGQTLTLNKYDLGHHQTMTYRICDVFGVRKHASG